MKTVLFYLCFLAAAFSASAQKSPLVGKKVGPVQVRDASDNPIMLPELGKKHLLIFYPDPDHAGQNKDFQDYMKAHPIDSDDIYAFGVVNLKDAPMLPNSIVRAMVRKEVKATGAQIYTDPDHLLRDAWGLGDVNNCFAVIFVTKDREIAYFKAGEMSEADKAEFFRVLERYK